MITELEVENIRLFDSGGWQFPLAPLTIFCGTNSSGKSTLLKTLLLLRLSIGIGETYEIKEGRLRLVGSQVDLGNYQSFVSHNEVSREIQVTVSIKDVIPPMFYQGFRSNQSDKRESDNSNEINDVPIPYLLRAQFRFLGLHDAKDELSSRAQIGKSLYQSPTAIFSKAIFTMYEGEEVNEKSKLLNVTFVQLASKLLFLTKTCTFTTEP